MALSAQDKAFLAAQKKKGLSFEEAWEKLQMAKGPSFGQRFMENLKAAPEAIFGGNSVTGKTIGQIPILKNVAEGVKDFATMSTRGGATVAEGVKEIYQGVKADQSAEEKIKDVVGGASQVIGGGMEAVFSPQIAAITNVPVIGGAIEKGLEFAGKKVDDFAVALAEEAGTDDESKAVIRQSVNNLAGLLAMKYGPQASEAMQSAITPYLKKIGDKLASAEVTTPKIDINGSQYRADIVKSAEAKGIDLPLSAQTSSGLVQGIEAIAKNGFFSKDLISKAETAQIKLDSLVSEAIKKIDSPSMSKLELGEFVKNDFSKMIDAFKEQKGNLYDAAFEQLNKTKNNKKVVVDPIETISTLDQFITSGSKSLTPGPSLKFFQDLKAKLEGKSTAANGKSSTTKGKLPTVEVFMETLKDIGKKLKNQNDPVATGDKGAISQLYATMSKDLDATYSKSLPEFGKAISEANNYFKTNIELINGKFGNMLDKITPEQVYNTFIKPNSPTAIGELRQLVGPESFTKISGTFLKDLIDSSIKNDKFSMEAFQKNLSKWDDATLQAILDESQFGRLQEVKTKLGELDQIQKAIVEGEKKFTGSQTGFLNKIDRLRAIVPAGVAGGAGGFAAAGLVGVGIVSLALLSYVLGDLGMSRLMTSEFGKKLFSEGVAIPGGKTTGHALNSIGNFLISNQNLLSQFLSENLTKGAVNAENLYENNQEF